MIKIEDLDNIVRRASEFKDLANDRNENFNYYLDAQKLYDEAYDKCKNTKLTSEIKQNFLCAVYQYESLDCQISYSLKLQEFDKVILLCSAQKDVLDEIFASYSINDIKEPEVLEIYKAFQNHKVSIGSKAAFSIGKRHFILKNFRDALYYFRRAEEIFKTIDTTILNQEFLSTFRLNYFILKFNISQCQLGILPTVTLNNDFLERQIIKELLESYKYAADVAGFSDDPYYENGKQHILDSIDNLLTGSVNDWQVLIDYTYSQVLWERMSELDNNRLLKLAHFSSYANKPKTDYLLFYTHGFNTRGAWKNDLTEVVSNKGKDSHVHFVLVPWDYGSFKIIRFLRKKARQRVLRDFIQRYQEILDIYGDCEKKCIIAHSFATYITGTAFQENPKLHCDKLILAGNILNINFDWDKLKNNNQIDEVLVEQSVNDLAVLAAKLYKTLFFVKWIGYAGRNGFDKEYLYINVLRTRSGHSGMLNAKNMNDNWYNFLVH